MAIKVVYDKNKGLYNAKSASESDSGFNFESGAKIEKPVLVGDDYSVTSDASVFAVTASVDVLFTLPENPVDGQIVTILKATTAAMTISITGSNDAHTINGLTTDVELLDAPGTSEVRFVSAPANMWVTHV